MRKFKPILAYWGNFKHHFCTRAAQDVLKIGILDVPFEKGQDKSGVAKGPQKLREAGLIDKLNECCGSLDIKDYGEFSYKNNCKDAQVSNMKHYDDVISCSKELSDKVEEIVRDDRICLTLGGDHSIGIGTIHGHIKARNDENIAVLWVDAHADLNTNQTSTSGNAHGMPMAFLAKELASFWPSRPGAEWFTPRLSVRNLAYIGLRSVDPYENAIMHNLGISYFDMFDIQRYGIDAVVSAALDKMDPHHNKAIHVSFDIDSLDPLEAPSTGTPVRGGLLLREGIHIMSAVYKTGRLGAMDMVEVNPMIGSESDVDKTLSAAIHIIIAAFGRNKREIKADMQHILPPINGFS
ncbi:hypothetical protein AMK59_8403 [Oryctes borbonicus]|uniref:Arginase n=1 Tax=Oryctes borbonicus TaxID=1629725 RepID=A0A0T6ATX2_9SCAR|nr:hypothetical protein AMK59_8403 [Oryctes borbonicus]